MITSLNRHNVSIGCCMICKKQPIPGYPRPYTDTIELRHQNEILPVKLIWDVSFKRAKIDSLRVLTIFHFLYSSQRFPIKVCRSHRSSNRGWDFARTRYGLDSAFLGRQTKTFHNLQIGTRGGQKSGHESGRDERSADSVKKFEQLNNFIEFLLSNQARFL